MDRRKLLSLFVKAVLGCVLFSKGLIENMLTAKETRVITHRHEDGSKREFPVVNVVRKVHWECPVVNVEKINDAFFVWDKVALESRNSDKRSN